MDYFKEASKSQVGLMRYNYYHDAWGYIALSQLLDCGRQYYMWLQLKKDDNNTLFVREGYTYFGDILD